MIDGVKSETVNVAKVFAPGRNLCLPAYQRSYSWSEREAMALLGDLTEAMEEDSLHFIGAIVIDEDSAGAPAHAGLPEERTEIVDGQQRLTTLTILLCVLRDLESDTQRTRVLDELIMTTGASGESVDWRLTLNHLDGDFFRAHIQRRGATTEFVEEPSESRSQERMMEVAAGFVRELRKMSADERRRLTRIVLERCCMTQVIVADRDMGYKVFRVLNDRGKAPNAHDIVKTDIFERANLTLQQANFYSARWAEYEAQIGGSAFDDLLRQIRVLFDRSAKGDLIAALRKSVIPRISARTFLDEVLPRHVRAYAEITTGQVDFGPLSAAITDHVNRMRALDHHSWRAPALKYLVERRHDEKNALDFFRALERLAYAMQLIVPKKDQRDKRYRRVAEALDTPRSLFSRSSPLMITRDEAKRIHERLHGRFGTFGQRRAMALRLNAALEGGTTLPPEADATVEHVLPRNPGEDSYWLTVWPDTAKRRELCDTLGNFILLPHTDNQLADRLNYHEKKKVYFDGAGGAHFALTRDLEHQETWTPDVVRRRTERLVEILMRDWGLA